MTSDDEHEEGSQYGREQPSRFDMEESECLMTINCMDAFCSPPKEELVKHYAWIGLHRYNLLKGTKFELVHLIKYNMTMTCVKSFFITLSARDADESPQIFQVQVDEQLYGHLDVVCSVARIKGDTNEPFILPTPMDRLPNWPSDDIFEDFYLKEGFLSSLKIEKEAIETPDDSPLCANSATIYISFKGLDIDGDNELNVEPKAIIKRVLDQCTGLLSLKGSLCFGGGRTPPFDRPTYSTSWKDFCLQNLQSSRP